MLVCGVCRYYRVLLNNSALFGLWAITLMVGVIVWGSVHGRKLCHSL